MKFMEVLIHEVMNCCMIFKMLELKEDRSMVIKKMRGKKKTYIPLICYESGMSKIQVDKKNE